MVRVSLRTFLPLLLLALGAGYGAGLVLAGRTLDRGAAAGPGDGPAAREALAAVRARSAAPPSASWTPAADRAAFLARWPRSWLRAHWQGGPR